MTRGPYCVELAGIPGAGKTWLSTSMAAELARLGLAVGQPDRAVGPSVGAGLRLSRKAAVSASAAVLDPRLSARLARSILASGQPGPADVTARFVQWQVAQGLLGRPGSPGETVRLLDEGLLQCLWSIGLRGDVERALGALDATGRWRAADLLVVVRTPPAVAGERLLARASRHSRVQSLPPEQLLAELERGDRLLDRLVGWWSGAAAPDRVVEVDGSAATSDDVRDLALRVASAVHDRPPAAGTGAVPRALHVVTRYQRGGSERRIRDAVAAVPELSHHLLLGRDSDVDLAREQTSADQVRLLPGLVRQVSPRDDLATLLQLRRTLRRGDYAVVVTHQSKAGALARLAALSAGGTPVVHSLSMASFGPGYGLAENLAFRALERLLGPRTDAFCVVGADLAARFEAVGVPGDRLHVVRSGVPLPDAVRPRADARRLLHERHGVPVDAPLLCYVGSLEPRKNVLLLAVLLYELTARLPSAPFLLVCGEGPQRAELAARLRALGLERQAVLTGHLSCPQHVSDALRGADVVALLSRTEGLPQVLVQAAAAGTPFVAFDVEGVRELLALGARGTAVRLGDVAAAADAAARHLAEDGPGDREPAADLTSWTAEAIRAAYRQVFRSVLGPAGLGDAPPVEAGAQVPAQTRHVVREQVG